MACSHHLALCMTLGGILGLQAQEPKMDPIRELMAETPLEEKQDFLLKVTVVSVPMKEAERAQRDDLGARPGYWRSRLTEWNKAGKLGAGIEMHTRPGTPLEGGYTHKYRYIPQNYAAHFWDYVESAKVAHMPPPDIMDEVLQALHEDEVGSRFTASVQHNGSQATIDIKLLYSAEKPETRSISTWPVPLIRAPYVFFRPWELVTTARVPVGPVFLLGTQMEPPHDGQAHTGHVLMAFGRITVPPAKKKSAPANAQVRGQTWTLSVSPELFVPWIAGRTGPAGDGEAWAAWLKRVDQQDKGVELLAISAVAVNGHGSINSDLHWDEGTGFEPGFNPTGYRALPESDNMRVLPYQLDLDLWASGSDESSPLRAGGEMMAYVSIERPGGPAHWERWKSAMERDETDPAAMEVSDVTGSSREVTSTALRLAAGGIVMVGACWKDERVHVTFLRAGGDLPEAAQPAAKLVPPPTLTTWIIDTPLTWQSKLLEDQGVNTQNIAEELLREVAVGKARLAGLVSVVSDRENEVNVSATNDVSFFGSSLNTRPHAQGIFFNPRVVQGEARGLTASLAMLPRDDDYGTDEGVVATFKLQTRDRPEWRHWGIWQPKVKATNAKNSGVRQPMLPVTTFEGRARLHGSAPQVIAAVRVSSLGSLNDSPATLRWYVARRDGPPPPEPVVKEQNNGDIHPRLVEAVFLRVPAGFKKGDPGTSAAALIQQARAGALEVLDLTLSSGEQASLTAGWDYHFPNGRMRREGAPESDAFKAPAVMPAGTEFDPEIELGNRVVGISMGIDRSKWMMARDARRPQVVTDSFAGAEIEWPPTLSSNPDDKPLRITVNVERPIFSVQEAGGRMLVPDTVSRIAEDVVMVLRVRLK